VTERKTIRQLREERGWTQLDLAHRLGVSGWSVYTWERGLFHPREESRRRLAELFGISVQALALGPSEQAPPDRP
jgi:putative transcriptional regulator